ncbi:UvrD-helicase domain-containing protein [Nostoc sp.]|uniref:UvrD-helicase domain-containing protein n=1 Tax=Nostoc sp. TaxID=1180 RepID=UPI002FF94D9E
MQQHLLNWISKQQNHLDEFIAKTADDYLEKDKNSRSNFIFDIQEANQEQVALCKGKDLCYDRPSVGFAYSLWYHGRRVNTFLNYLVKVFSETTEEQIEIFDLGAGTGAIQWAVGVIYAGMKSLNILTPKLKIINIDNSPFMLQYHQLLWEQFVSHYSECSDINWEYKINSWNNSETSDNKTSWICASYLFDSTENKEAIANDFIELIQMYDPKTLILLTSNQPCKRKYLEDISAKIKNCGYKVEENHLKSNLFDGVMTAVSQRREQYRRELDIHGLTGQSQWNDHSFTGKVFKREITQQITLIDILDNRQSIQSIDIYSPPTKERREIELSDAQKKAARHSDRPTIITGSAGSGKSIVITERIKNLVEQNQYNPELRILLTTFNKELIGQLGDWLQEILDSNRCKRIVDSCNQGEPQETSKFEFLPLNLPNIQLMHFDVLPTRLGEISGKNPYKDFETKMMSNIISEVKNTDNTLKEGDEDVLKPDFLLDEFHRIFYGLDYRTKEIYLGGIRKGRGVKPRLRKYDRRREIVWNCLEHYYNILELHNIHEFTRIRLKFLDQLKANQKKGGFTHIFVDEFQDCTEADFEIFYHLLQNPDNLVIAGDFAQAVHLGLAAFIPKQADMSRREIFRLESSYRLPYRISECIRELSKRIIYKHRNNQTNISPNEITPYKGSPPGARPIVVFATTVDAISKKIKEIFETYREAYGLNKITILEKDPKLCYALRKLKIDSETDTILRIKGLEKECVLWSVRTRIDHDNEAEEIVYTILTRTSSILIIALSEEITNVYKEIIGTFDKDRLIFWDQETKNRYSEFWKKQS